MLDDKTVQQFILSLNRVILNCCNDYSADKVEALSAIGQIFMCASVAGGFDLQTFDASLVLLREAFKLALEERRKSI